MTGIVSGKAERPLVVHCVGGGQWYETWEDAEIGADRNIACGWTGTVQLDPNCICGDAVRLTNALPDGCPKCGGEVELIRKDDQ